jgi:hypothetical protein
LFVLPLALSLAGSNPGIRGIDCHTTCWKNLKWELSPVQVLQRHLCWF